MSTVTTNYSLTKPATSDLIDISVLNGDLDTLDTTLKSVSDVAGGAVPKTTTVNSHALSGNVSVTLSDVGGAPSTEVVNTVASAGTAQTLAEPAVKSINDLTLDNASPCVLTFPTSTAGTSFTLVLRQSGSTRTVTWPGGIKWAGGLAPTLSTTTGSIDIFSFVYVTAWNGFVAGLAMA